MRASGTVALVSWAGAAEGSRAAAAALACAGADLGRAGLLVELADRRSPRPALVASAAARELEERLAAHLPESALAARGHICHLTLPADLDGLERAPAALALVREATGVVHLPPRLLRAALAARLRPDAVLLRADLKRDRALVGLATRDLMARGLRVAVLKRPLAWIPSRRALFGVLPADAADGLPVRLRERCLAKTAGTAELLRRAEPIGTLDDLAA
jgi:hypothetical protein